MPRGWEPILHVHASHIDTAHVVERDLESGWVIGAPNPYCEDVTVRLHVRETEVRAHMPWSDRPEGFEHFLTSCGSVLRMSAAIGRARDGRYVTVRYTLCVSSDELCEQLLERGSVRGEPYALAALRHYAPLAQLPCSAKVFRVALSSDVALSSTGATAWATNHPLYEAQRRSLEWMHRIETAIVKGTNQIAYDACIPLGASGVVYDMYLDMLRRDGGASLKARFRGACLCDAVGTGKTACVLALAATRLDELPTPGELLRARGTCVVVPMNLPTQWAEEAEKFVPGLRVILLTSARDLRAHTLHDILAADIVVTTTNYMRNPTVRDQLDELAREVLDAPRLDRRECRSHATMCAMSRSIRRVAKEDATPPFVELAYWPRLVVDEIHELLKDCAQARDRRRTLGTLHARILWGLTATPDTSKSEALQSLYILLEPKVAEESHHHHPCLQAAVEHGLLGRFAEERGTVALEHRLTLVHLSARERVLVDASPLMTPDCVIQLCTCPAASDDGEDKVALIRRDGEERLRALCARASDAEAQLVQLGIGGGDVTDVVRHMRDDDDTIATARAAVSYLARRIANVDDSSEACPVCCEAASRSLLTCGHVLCALCARRMQNGNAGKCPVCRAPFERVYDVSGEKASGSSKIDAVVRLLDESCKAGGRVLLFSQWPAVLSAVASRAAVRVALLTGPTTRRATAIRRYRDGEIDVLALSLERSSAGLHLAGATDVIFAHCVTGDAQEALAMEQQAIGRAVRSGGDGRVTVHHVIAEGTAEEARWRQRHSGQAVVTS
jgi:hypothetical protein